MALASIEQTDFGGGIHRGRVAPENAVYDAVNALVGDDGLLFKRGGTSYKSNANAGTTLVGLADFLLGADATSGDPSPPQTVFWSTTKIYGLTYSDDVTPTADITGAGVNIPRAFARGAGVGARWYVPSGGATSNQMTYIAVGATGPTTGGATSPAKKAEFVTTAGTRLIVTSANRAYYSARGDGTSIGTNDYHELPPPANIIGADSFGDTAVLFTTQGVYTINNLSLDAVDAFGNIQHVVERVGDLILWGDPGVTGYSGALIVPAVDDVWLFTLGAPPVPITGDAESEKIRRLYRSYVKSGYQPGTASLHRGHYFLPVVNGTTWIDTLVCRLDRGAAWTRLSGHAACTAYAQRVGSSTRSPKLFAVSGQRVLNASDLFDPAAANSADADATVPSMTVITRDYPLGADQPGFCQRIRVRAEVTDDANGFTAAAAATVEVSSDQDSGTFTTLSERGEQDGATGWATSTAAKYWWALVGKRRHKIRFRLTFSGGTASTILRSVTLLVRPTGKQ